MAVITAINSLITAAAASSLLGIPIKLDGLTAEDKNIKVIIDNEEVEFDKKDVALIRLAIKF